MLLIKCDEAIETLFNHNIIIYKEWLRLQILPPCSPETAATVARAAASAAATTVATSNLDPGPRTILSGFCSAVDCLRHLHALGSQASCWMSLVPAARSTRPSEQVRACAHAAAWSISAHAHPRIPSTSFTRHKSKDEIINNFKMATIGH